MERLKHILKKLLFPSRKTGTTAGLLFLIFIALIFIFRLYDHPISYAAYLLSAYGLYLLIVSQLIPSVDKVISLLRRNRHIDRYFTDSELRARVALYSGAVTNILYALFKLTSGLYYRSYWMTAIAFYYIAMFVVKTVLIQSDMNKLKRGDSDKAYISEWKAYRRAGWLMFLMGMMLAGVIVQVVMDGRSYEYADTLIYAMALYAFYRIIATVLRLLSLKDKRSPIFSAAAIIDFVIAAAAMFTLQTAMLSKFGTGAPDFVYTFNNIGGTAAAIIVLGSALYMIIHARRRLKTAK